MYTFLSHNFTGPVFNALKRLSVMFQPTIKFENLSVVALQVKSADPDRSLVPT